MAEDARLKGTRRFPLMHGLGLPAYDGRLLSAVWTKARDSCLNCEGFENAEMFST